MAGKKVQLQSVSHRPRQGRQETDAARRGNSESRGGNGHPVVSGRWLLGALALVLGAVLLCAWGVLCLLFWQGSWQLLYHPAAAIARTPASAGVAFDGVQFAASDAGMPRLAGWWIAAAPDARFARLTVLYLHGQNGNLSSTVDAIARLHAAGVNVLAFDYRGYGKSQFARPSEAHWREDADWALDYLTGTRHVALESIVLDGADLGANLALEVAAAHPELAGAIVESPNAEPMRPVFGDARARLIPARLLVRDRYDLSAAATNIRMPVLWFASDSWPKQAVPLHEPEAYEKMTGRKMLFRLDSSAKNDEQVKDALVRWLDDLPAR